MIIALLYDGLLDWGFYGYSWLTQSTTDPLSFYPPENEFTYNYPRDPLEVYMEAGFVETRSNIGKIFLLI